jgi:hypothetical protein
VSNKTRETLVEPPPYPEGLVLKAWITPRWRPVDIARKAGVSRAFVAAVMAGRAPASLKVRQACAELGLPVDVIWNEGET